MKLFFNIFCIAIFIWGVTFCYALIRESGGILTILCAVTTMGCTTPPTLVTEVRVVEKPVPVVTKCVAENKIPPVPKTHFLRGGNIESNAAAASADVRELVIYADNADTLLRQCAGP